MGGPLPPKPAGSKRRIASTLDTAVLVFFVLVLASVAWWLLRAVVGTFVFFAKLAVLALLVALAIRAYLWVRDRRHRTGSS